MVMHHFAFSEYTLYDAMNACACSTGTHSTLRCWGIFSEVWTALEAALH